MEPVKLTPVDLQRADCKPTRRKKNLIGSDSQFYSYYSAVANARGGGVKPPIDDHERHQDFGQGGSKLEMYALP